MKKLLVALLAIAGCTALLAPLLNRYQNAMRFSYTIEDYDRQINSEGAQRLKKELQKAQEYNSSLTRLTVVDPFSGDTGTDRDALYDSLLNVDDVMATLEIPKIGVYLPVYHGTSEEVLQRGVGHLSSSSLPVGGEGTHTVLTGHTGLPSAKLFSDLTEMKEGDMFYINVLGDTLAYEVDQIKVVKPEDMEDLRIEPDKDYATLLTCTPYGVNSHRLLVRGARTAFDEEERRAGEDMSGYMQRIYRYRVILGAIFCAICIVLLLLLCHFRRKRVKCMAERP